MQDVYVRITSEENCLWASRVETSESDAIDEDYGRGGCALGFAIIYTVACVAFALGVLWAHWTR
jgi:hypothetical protein